MTIGIYGIFDAQTDECLYVGQSKEIEVRFRQHITKLKNKRSNALKLFVDWYHDHGPAEENLALKVLESCKNDRLLKNQLEAKWFDELSPKFFGKIPSLSESWDHTPETRRKIAESIRRSKGNMSGVSQIKSKGVRPQRNNKEIAPKIDKLSTEEKHSNFDSKWKDQIIKWYTSDNLSCREISRRMGLENKIRIQTHLRRYGIDVTPRTFNNRTFSTESRKQISSSLSSHFAEKAIFIDCASCKVSFRIKPSSVNQKFCSKNCRWDYDSEHSGFPDAEALAEELLKSSFYKVSKKYGNAALIRRYLKNRLTEDHPVFGIGQVSKNPANV